jgi:ubiquinone/menaquinone biosynthesis C-methylase UbiE
MTSASGHPTRDHVADSASWFSHLHPTAITSQREIRILLHRLFRNDLELHQGMNRKILPETARIKRMDSSELLLQTKNFDFRNRRRIFLNFSIDGVPYFFSSFLLEELGNSLVRIEIPAVIYQSERRDRSRRKPTDQESKNIVIISDHLGSEVGEIVDSSPQGMGIIVTDRVARSLGSGFRVRFVDGIRQGEEVFAEVRQRVSLSGRPGWAHIGLDVSSVPRGGPLESESRNSVIPSTAFSRMRQRWRILSAGARIASDHALEKLQRKSRKPPEIRIVDYKNEKGERIRAIVDSTGVTAGAPTVIIPPAWGKTKETLMPLSACLISAFQAAGQPLSVIRFDGIRKRGESQNDPECNPPGKHHHHFTFSQGVRDIQATLDFLDSSPHFQPSKRILVSFSASSIESRRATADDPRIDGWVSVVGASDLQSMMRVISGGVDYAVGLERGISFGLQEILGIEVDMDLAGLDAFDTSLAYLEDARREMARIKSPITWIHGRYDAWMNSERARDVLSRGDTSNRRFIEVPTGHMLSTSREAIETFQLITREVSRMAIGFEIEPVLPDLAEVELRRKAERRRLPKESVDLRTFWRDYLVGRSADLGIELMTSIAPYQELMQIQVKELRISEGNVVADLGAGTGSFPRFLTAWEGRPNKIHIVELDFVRAGLERARSRLMARHIPDGLKIEYIESDFEFDQRNTGIVLRSEAVDAVLASLLVSYLCDPACLLSEIRRVLRPGGRLVVSSLCRDADMSKLYVDGVNELRSGLARELFGRDGERQIEDAVRDYLNQASRLLGLEEDRQFRFWDPNELKNLVKRAGFRNVSAKLGLGDPPQAVVVSAERA